MNVSNLANSVQNSFSRRKQIPASKLIQGIFDGANDDVSASLNKKKKFDKVLKKRWTLIIFLGRFNGATKLSRTPENALWEVVCFT